MDDHHKGRLGDPTFPAHLIVCPTKRMKAMAADPTTTDALIMSHERQTEQQVILAALAHPRLYIDIDGVILCSGDGSAWNTSWCVAPHAFEFLSWATARFQCRWLTARCRDGDIAVIERAIRHGIPAINLPPAWRDLIRSIPVAPWSKLKIDGIALAGDWWWLDDNPQPEALLVLERLGLEHRWIETNTDAARDDLLRVQRHLEQVLVGMAASAGR